MTDTPLMASLLPTTVPAALTPLTPEDYDALDLILDDLRTRSDETPQWEFCEGFLAALVCCRRQMSPDEYLPVLLDVPDQGGATDAPDGHEGAVADADQRQRFLALWQRRWHAPLRRCGRTPTPWIGWPSRTWRRRVRGLVWRWPVSRIFPRRCAAG